MNANEFNGHATTGSGGVDLTPPDPVRYEWEAGLHLPSPSFVTIIDALGIPWISRGLRVHIAIDNHPSRSFSHAGGR